MSGNSEWLRDQWKNNREEMEKRVTKNLKFADAARAELKIEDPEKYHSYGKAAAIRLNKWNKEFYGDDYSKILSDRAKETHKKHPDLAHRLGKITQERYPNAIEWCHNWARDNPDEFHEIMIKSVRKARKTNIKNKPYWFMGVPFDSKGEVKVAKYLNSKIGFIPEYGVNTQHQVDTKFIDFYIPEYNLFIEYHPYDLAGRTDEEYLDDRTNVVINGGYSEPVILIKSIDELNTIPW